MTVELKTKFAVADATEIDAAIVERLKAMPEHLILAYFWLMYRKGAERLPLLLQLSKVVVERPATWDRAQVRREHEQWVKHRPMVIDTRMCFACGDTGHRHYFHHILEVQHGGSNTGRNLVPLCFACHQYLHPWLTEEPASVPQRGSGSGFESLHDILTTRGLVRLHE